MFKGNIPIMLILNEVNAREKVRVEIFTLIYEM
jgi:hypothetical protein